MTEKEEKKRNWKKDMLFATLDTAQRNVKLDTNQEFVLIDTVGFVSKRLIPSSGRSRRLWKR